MVIIFWEKDAENQRIDYFYDFSSNRIYRCCLAQYESKYKFKATPGNLVLIVCPLISITGLLFDNRTFTLSLVTAAIFILLILLVLILTNKRFNASEEKKYLYVRNNGEIQNMILSRELYKKGLRIRVGWCGFIMTGLFCVFMSIVMYRDTGNVTSIIVLYISIFSTFGSIKLLAPLKNRRLKKLVKQNQKLKEKREKI